MTVAASYGIEELASNEINELATSDLFGLASTELLNSIDIKDRRIVSFWSHASDENKCLFSSKVYFHKILFIFYIAYKKHTKHTRQMHTKKIVFG